MKKTITILGLVATFIIVAFMIGYNTEADGEPLTKNVFYSQEFNSVLSTETDTVEEYLMRMHPIYKSQMDEKKILFDKYENFKENLEKVKETISKTEDKDLDLSLLDNFIKENEYPFGIEKYLEYDGIGFNLSVLKEYHDASLEIKEVRDRAFKVQEEIRIEQERLEQERLEKERKEAEAARWAASIPQRKPSNSNNSSSSNSSSNSNELVYKANQLCISGICKTYINTGLRGQTAEIQILIDQHYITGSVTNFNPHDGQTTYFAGHHFSNNRGVMNYMNANIYDGAIITVTDGSGNPYKYKIQNHVYSYDPSGRVGSFGPNGAKAIDVYMRGTGVESIAIQFCREGGRANTVWYGVPLF